MEGRGVTKPKIVPRNEDKYTGKKDTQSPKGKYYAVAYGKTTGVFTKWEYVLIVSYSIRSLYQTKNGGADEINSEKKQKQQSAVLILHVTNASTSSAKRKLLSRSGRMHTLRYCEGKLDKDWMRGGNRRI